MLDQCHIARRIDFQFRRAELLLPQEQDGVVSVSLALLKRIAAGAQLVAQMEQQEGKMILPPTASREILFYAIIALAA